MDRDRFNISSDDDEEIYENIPVATIPTLGKDFIEVINIFQNTCSTL